MSVREYIGARYIPLFSDPIEWDNTRSYEPLTVVINQGNSYVSKQFVPIGAELPAAGVQSNDYWLLWADYNAQIEQYRAEVETYSGRINANTAAVQALNGELTTEVGAREAADTAIREDFAADLAEEIASVNATISADVDRLETQDEALGARIDKINPGITIAVPETAIIKVTKFDLPEGHVVQSMEIVDDFIYVGHHVSDAEMFYISKYSNTNYALVSRSAIATGIHGNSLSFDVVSNCVVLCDTATLKLYFININTLSVEKTRSFESAGATLGALAFSRDGVHALGFTTVSKITIPYQQVHNDLFDALLALGVNKSSEARSRMGKQDVCSIGSREPYAQLLSNWANLNKENAIAIYNRFGDEIATYVMPNVFEDIELEGIACVLNSQGNVTNFYIVDVEGNLYDVAEPYTAGTPNALFAGWSGYYYTYNNAAITPAGAFAVDLTPAQRYQTTQGINLVKWFPVPNEVPGASFGNSVITAQFANYLIQGVSTYTPNFRFAVPLISGTHIAQLRIEYNHDTALNLNYLAFARLTTIANGGTLTSTSWSFVSPGASDASDNDAKYQSFVTALASINVGMGSGVVFNPTRIASGVNVAAGNMAIAI